MLVFRISKTVYIHDLTGIGAWLYGGRWNPKGVSIVYTSSSRALATVEYLVHSPMGLTPNDLSIATIEAPEKTTAEKVDVKKLPGNWAKYESLPELADIGQRWVKSNRSLLLKVPSAVVEDDFNILINPAHPDISKVKIINVQPYTFDKRLF